MITSPTRRPGDSDDRAPRLPAGRSQHPSLHPDTLRAGNPREDASSPGTTTFSSPPCVDLQAIYGSRFKIRKEADGVTWFETPEPDRVWLRELPSKYGIVYPRGGDLLAATITSRQIGRRVAALPCICTSRGDVERVVTFPLDDAEAVLALLKPQRRRQLSPEARERLVTIGQGHRFTGAQAPKTERESTQASGDSLEVQPERDVLLAVADVTPSEGAGTGRKLAAGQGVP